MINFDRPGIAAVLFDLDGTLIDTTELIFQSYQHGFGLVLGTPMTREELYLGFGRPLPEAVAAILEQRGVVLPAADFAALVDRILAEYRVFNRREHDRLTREFPGVRETLAELRRRGYRLGLVTSKTRDIAERGLALAGLNGAFEVEVFMEDSIFHKPHPDPLWVALERLGLREHPERAIYVGDSTHDMIAGNAGGLRTAAALWGPFPLESLLALRPTFAVERIADLVGVLEGT